MTPDRNDSNPLAPFVRLTVIGARIGFSCGFALLLAEVVALSAPLAWKSGVYALVGSSLVVGLWHLTGWIFARLSE